jgi:hypothetical protein
VVNTNCRQSNSYGVRIGESGGTRLLASRNALICRMSSSNGSPLDKFYSGRAAQRDPISNCTGNRRADLTVPEGCGEQEEQG